VLSHREGFMKEVRTKLEDLEEAVRPFLNCGQFRD
jgi:hypothetical protein